ncbi:MAG: hypothetical protein M3281_07915 [Chloroflexota bacterium]|nr:hypothetical protein [Chloroflexota bacterium]
MYDEMHLQNHRTRYQQYLRDLETARLIRSGSVRRPSHRARILARLGESLVALGTGLRERYAPASS